MQKKKVQKLPSSRPTDPPRRDSPHFEARVVPTSGWFLGASGSLFLQQWAGDIYLQPYWDTLGTLSRVATVSTSWGISLGVIETAFRAAPDQLHTTPWQYAPLEFLRIHVEDYGQVPLANRPDIPHLAGLVPGPGPLAVYQVAGAIVFGHSMPWHHTLELTATNNDFLHYHKHDTRVGHGPAPPILPRHRGKHYVFHKAIYTTQVQNCRRVVGPGVVEWEGEEAD